MTFAHQAYSTERRVLLEGGAKEGLVGEEHDDELGRRLGNCRQYAFGRELRDVLAHLPRVVGEAPLAARRRRTSRNGVEVRDERRLGVDDDVLAAGDAARRGRGADVPPRRRRRRLLVEVAVLDHARQLDDVAAAAPRPSARGRAACAARS